MFNWFMSEGLAVQLLYSVTALFVFLRTYVEVVAFYRSWRANREVARINEEARRNPGPPFDPIAYDKRVRELLASGWYVHPMFPGVFLHDVPHRRAPNQNPTL